MLRFAALLICALLMPAFCAASPLWISGSAGANWTSVGCGAVCAGWDSATGADWFYGVQAQPSSVKFVPWSGFSGEVDGAAFGLGALQFQNAQYWGSGAVAQDDPSSHYFATLSGTVAISGGQSVTFSYALSLDTLRNGVDTLTGLPASPIALPFAYQGNAYNLNLLGFQVNGAPVTSLAIGEWGYSSATLMGNITTRASLQQDGEAPEPSTWAMAAAGALLLGGLRRRLRR